MSLDIDNKIYRNMQEQVAHNASNIQKIKEYLDGIQFEDKLVVIDATSGNISDEELAILMQSLAFISYNNGVYIKYSESLTEIVFKLCGISALEVGSAYFNIGGEKVVVTKSTKAYEVQSDPIIATYSKSQIDSIVANIMALKADKSELNEKANLSGAAFTGAITSPSIIENMSGYSCVVAGGGENYEHTPIYVGIVKTGNKLTVALFFAFTKKGTYDGGHNLVRINIPKEVRDKLIPFSVGGNDYLDVKKGVAVSTISIADIKDVTLYATKNELLCGIFLAIRDWGSLTNDTQYLIRYELTFLLSNSLV